jgi:hypothetical protein
MLSECWKEMRINLISVHLGPFPGFIDSLFLSTNLLKTSRVYDKVRES